MSVAEILPLMAALLMFAFAATVLARYARKRQLHNLFWGLGLLMFGLGSLAEALLARGWNDSVFRVWYLCGAVLNAGWLGHGTLLLIERRGWTRYLSAGLLVLSAVGVIAVFTLSLNAQAFDPAVTISAQYKDILPAGAPVRILTPIFNIYGSLFLVGGALYSALLFWRKRVLWQRVAGNVLIAVGALSIASVSTLTRYVLGGGYLYIGELVAAILMFSGYMLASAQAAERWRKPAEAQASP